jgi:hypothetical protein
MSEEHDHPESEVSAGQRYEVYWKERATIGAQQYQTAQSLDKAILTVASGALAMTLAGRQYIAPNPIWWTKWLVVVAWGALGAAILFVLWAMMASQKWCEVQEAVVERRYLDPNCQERTNEWSAKTDRRNWLAIRSLTAGVALVALFAAVNFLMAG